MLAEDLRVQSRPGHLGLPPPSTLSGMRLERHDPYLTTFTAKVVEQRNDAAGTWLRLDRSAFYPTSGGQPHDTGALHWGPSTTRIGAVETEAGAVWHLAAGADTATEGRAATEVPEVGTDVEGHIDWPRRFTHMQRHSGQHLLSQAFVRVGERSGREFATRSVSLRRANCTLDVAGEPDDASLAAIEEEADAAARRALPVVAFEVDDSKLGNYRLRRPAKVSGLVRLVAIGDYDLVACGGTHVRSSAELLPLKLLGRERVKGGLTRVTFRVGAEALSDLAAKHRVTAGLSALLSAPVEALPPRVEGLLGQLATAEQALTATRAALASNLASSLLAGGTAAASPATRVVSRLLDASDAALYEPLIDILQAAAGHVSLLACGAADGSVRFAFLSGPGVEVDVRPALQAALQVVGGKGGGRPDRAQGAGPDGREAHRALEVASQLLNH